MLLGPYKSKFKLSGKQASLYSKEAYSNHGLNAAITKKSEVIGPGTCKTELADTAIKKIEHTNNSSSEGYSQRHLNNTISNSPIYVIDPEEYQ